MSIEQLEPMVTQNLNRIEDDIVVQAIARRMRSFESGSTAIYDQETGIAHDKAAVWISSACAEVYQPDLTDEEIWTRARKHCIDATVQLTESYTNATNPGVREVFLQNATDGAKAAFAMYALDRQAGRLHAEDKDGVDLLITSTRHNSDLEKVVSSAMHSAWETGLIVFGDNVPIVPVPLHDLIDQRYGEIETYEHADLVKEVRSLAQSTSRDETNQVFDTLESAMLQSRLTERLSTKHWDDYLTVVYAAVKSGHHTAAGALYAVPRAYLEKLSQRNDDASHTFEQIIAACADKITAAEVGEEPSIGLMLALQNYYPDGLADPAFKRDPDLRALCAVHQNQPTAIVEMLPGEPIHLDSEALRQDYNKTIESLLRSLCLELFEDRQFAATFCQDIIRSIRPRKFKDIPKTDNKDTVSAYNCVAVYDTLKHFARLADEASADALKRLHETFDLAAIDMFTPEDISTLTGILDREPKVLERLRQQDVSLIAFDAYGSHNEAMRNILHQLQPDDPKQGRIVLPWRHQEDFATMIELLKESNVQFCNLVFAAHGTPGEMIVNKGSEGFRIINEQLSNPADLEQIIEIPAMLYEKKRNLQLRELRLRKILRDYMCPPKYAHDFDLPNKKRIIFASCSSDVKPFVGKSTAEVAVRQAGNHGVVFATENVTYVNEKKHERNGLYMHGPKYGEDEASYDANDPNNKPNMVLLEKGSIRSTWVSDGGAVHTLRTRTLSRTPVDKGISV